MATNFFKGKRYSFNVSNMSSVNEYEYLYFSYLKMTNDVGGSFVLKGMYKLYDDGSSWKLYEVKTSSECEFIILGGNAKVEFIYDYELPRPTPSSDWQSICTQIGTNAFSQVSVYNSNTSQWVDLPCASEYTGIATTLVDSGRNAKGVVIGDVIASDIAKVEIKWNFLTVEQYSEIAQLFEPKYNNNDPQAFFRAVRFFDVVKGDFDGDNSEAPNTTTNRCRIMYCGDRKVAFAKMKLDESGKPIGYQGVSLNLIDTNKIYGE